MTNFYSKKNQVFPVFLKGTLAVEKHFASLECYQQELAISKLLENVVALPSLLHFSNKKTVREYSPYPTLLTELERQESFGFDPKPWNMLVNWLAKAVDASSCLPEQGNLRNYLWNYKDSQIIGLDFEEYTQTNLIQCIANLIATVLTYNPANTIIKQQIAAELAQKANVAQGDIISACNSLELFRKEKPKKVLSAIILAGGASRRMGCDKSAVMLNGKSLLQRQVEKLQLLGINDILISGANASAISNAKVVSDVYPCRGPLGGLHACLQVAKNPQCLVISVDTPLVPYTTLWQLVNTHTNGVTMLVQNNKEQPLIAVYDSCLHKTIAPLISQKSVAVYTLKQHTAWNTFDFLGPKEFLTNCNTPNDIVLVKRLIEKYSKKGLQL